MAEAALGLSFAAFVVFTVSGKRPALYVWAHRGVGLSALCLLGLLVYRSVLISFPALTGGYEGLVFLSGALSAFLYLGEKRVLRSNHVLMAGGAFASFLYLALLSSPLVSPALHAPIPILRSHWLLLHVSLTFIGLALFTLAAVAGVLGFFQGSPEAIDRARDTSVAIGFVFYVTGGLVFGAVWAEAAWGRFWGWDPKETWALVTSLFYAGYLHLRYGAKVGNRTARVLVITAWLLAAFTFWGVNALLPGLHSYA